MNIAFTVSTRSSCSSRQVGSVIVNKEKMIISSGFNGTPRSMKNCDEGGCPRCQAKKEGKIVSGEGLDDCLCVHAEQNSIVHAAFHGISTKDATIYTTLCPCKTCSLLIIQAGIRRVVYNQNYIMEKDVIKLLRDAGVELVMIK